MNNYNFDNEIIKVYNGTNHPVAIYHLDNENFISKRGKKEYILRDDAKVKPVEFYPKQVPLSVDSAGNPLIKIGNINYSYPDNIKPIIPFEGYRNYDVIIVSSLYAEAVKLTAINFNTYEINDYLDRLYIVHEPIFSPHAEKIIGSGSLLKPIGFKGPEIYNQEIHNGHKPSLVSMIYCLEYCKYNPALVTSVNQLSVFVNQEIKARKAALIYTSEKALCF